MPACLLTGVRASPVERMQRADKIVGQRGQQPTAWLNELTRASPGAVFWLNKEPARLMQRLPPTMQVMASQSKVMFVAIEYGGEWRVDLRPDGGTDLIMVVQVVGEDPLVFARRFLGKVVSVVARGADVVSAVLAVAPIFDVRRLEARCAIARTALRAFRRGSSSELCLIEPSNATPDCRPQLLAIAEGLAENACSDCQIRVAHVSVGSVGVRVAGTAT